MVVAAQLCPLARSVSSKLDESSILPGVVDVTSTHELSKDKICG